MSTLTTQDDGLEVLRLARQAAEDSDEGYNSQEIRSKITNKFHAAFDGKSPYGWQVDVTEALLLERDVIVIASTGAGKTMPFCMPLLIDETRKKKVLIISPLNELEEEQAERFKKLGLTATAVNGDCYTSDLHAEIEAGQHQVLLTSPEMCLEHVKFSKLLRTPEFTKHIAVIVIDEAHCVSQWGESFRKKYSELGKLRSFVPTSTPFLVTSATFPPHILDEVKRILFFQPSKTVSVNLGNQRPNITSVVGRMCGAATDLDSLNFAIDEALKNEPLKRTIIFTNTRDLAMKACKHLRSLVPPTYQTHINFLHAGRHRNARRKVSHDFRAGTHAILCATEAAGMGLDIPDVDRVIGYMVPTSLSVWTQRGGRAGRGGQDAEAILLVEPSVHQLKKRKPAEAKKMEENKENDAVGDEQDDDNDDDDDDDESPEQMPAGNADPKYKKRVEWGMRNWIEANDCRGVVSDKYFANPRCVRVHDPRHCCCDLCVLRKVKNKEELTARESYIYQLHKRINSRLEALDGSAPKQPKARKAIGLGRRRDDRLEACKNTLTDWRTKTYTSEFKHCVFGAQALMSDKILTKLASCADIKTVEAIKGQIPDWVWADEYGEAVLGLLEPIDSSWKAETTAKAKENRAKKAKVKAEAKQTEAVHASQYMQPLLSIPVNVMAHPFNPQGPIPFPALHQHLPPSSLPPPAHPYPLAHFAVPLQGTQIAQYPQPFVGYHPSAFVQYSRHHPSQNHAP